MSLEMEELTVTTGDVFEDFLIIFRRCLAKYLDIGEDMNVPDDFTQSELQTGKWWRHLLAGGIAGAVSRTCTAPLDRLKVFLQVNPNRENMRKCLKKMIGEGGISGMWRGNGINVIKIAPESALKFAAYEQVKRLIKGEKTKNGPLEIHERFVAGATAGAISQTVIYPLEVLKTRLALRKTGQYSGIADAAKKIYAREGLKCFYKGYIPNILGIVPYAGIDLAVYETLKKKYISTYQAHNEQPGMLLLLACGSTSCTLGQVCSYPLALVRTRLQAQETTAKGVQGTLRSTVRDIIQREGFRGLYRGITPNFIKVTKMPSDAKKRAQQKKKEQASSRNKKPVTRVTNEENGTATNGNETKDRELTAEEALCLKLEAEAKMNSEARSCTGSLAVHPRSRDVKIANFSITFYGSELLQDTLLELNCGRRYGLVGLNGCGKSSLLSALGRREVPIPAHIDIFHLTREMPASDKTALECVMEVDEERIQLEKLAEELAQSEDDESQEQLMDVYDRLDDLSADTAEARAANILHGLGFTKEMQQKATKDFSGGWRMRIALARALYVKPHLLLLDEPTNHLDLDACVWLEEELKHYKRILVLISHSQDFLNGVCTNIIHMSKRRLKYYTGNYEAFVRTRMELLENQMKQYNWEQDQIAHMKNYIARFGHGSAKLARQAQSKEKTLAKMVAQGLTEKVIDDKILNFYFPSCGKVPPPVIMVQNVSFRYTDSSPWIYKNLEFGIDLDTRLALVGPNGAGKSTLLKLLYGDLVPSIGMIRKNSHLRIGRYHQHLHELLDLDLSPLDYMMKEFPEVREREEMRKIIGRYGLTGRQQVCPMRQLSDGQRCRVVFAWLAWQTPHLLLLDEPTNHLDMETIDALGDAINEFDGGMVLVSHDFRLINQVAEEIWICENGTVTKWEGGILKYKDHLKSKILKENADNAAKLRK